MAEHSFSNVMRTLLGGMLLSLLLPIGGCSGDADTGPVDVKWDRDVCARCNMVLSDRRHAAQVRRPATDASRSEVKKFDDLGCAVLWLDQQAWHDEAGVEIWVVDYQTGEWIDARSAYYVTDRQTPMQYGLGAVATPTPESLSFADAREHIYRVEQKFNVHGGNLDHTELPSIR